MNAPLLAIDALHTRFFTRAGVVRAVDGVTLHVAPGEIVGLVGESGSGKSVTGYSILGLVEPPGRVVSGSIRFAGDDLARLDAAAWRRLRGDRIAMIFQDPMTTLHPVLRIGTQIVEAIRAHADVTPARAREWAREALAQVGIPAPEERLAAYPHQLSGGMRQRVAIAIALLHRPALVIADEPTTALDVTTQARILDLVRDLVRAQQSALVWITHDLAVVAGLADRIAVMYAGRIVESGPVAAVLGAPLHPYTRGLLDSLPARNERGRPLAQIPGAAPSLLAPPEGCTFRPRCARASARCMSVPAPFDFGAERHARCFHPLGAPEP